MFSLEVYDAAHTCISSSQSNTLAQLDVRYREYQPGDYILLTTDTPGVELEAMFDICLPPSIIYLSETSYRFDIPFGVAREPYGQHAFTGDCHWGYVKAIDLKSRQNYVCLSQNSMDVKTATGFYPHASTNSGATNVRFLARNAIDGIFQTCHHGRWPYQSFGINGRDDAWLKVDFGREVLAEDIIMYLRADFPHDAWWKEVTVTFSDGSQEILHMAKTDIGQTFSFTPRKVTWFKLSDFKKADDPSPWPALSQVQMMGRLL